MDSMSINLGVTILEARKTLSGGEAGPYERRD